MTSSEYGKIFSGWKFAYLTLDASDVGLSTSGTYFNALENFVPDVTPLNVNIGDSIRRINNTPKNLEYEMTGETTFYAIFVPVITVKISSDKVDELGEFDKVDELGEFEYTMTVAERVSNSLSNIVAIFRNKLREREVDLSEFEADYVTVDGSSYQLKTGGAYNYIAYISKSNNEIIIKVVWKKLNK